jgi:hypothetical protein
MSIRIAGGSFCKACILATACHIEHSGICISCNLLYFSVPIYVWRYSLWKNMDKSVNRNLARKSSWQFSRSLRVNLPRRRVIKQLIRVEALRRVIRPKFNLENRICRAVLEYALSASLGTYEACNRACLAWHAKGEYFRKGWWWLDDSSSRL